MSKTDIPTKELEVDDLRAAYAELGAVEYNIIRFKAYLKNLQEQKSVLIDNINSKTPQD